MGLGIRPRLRGATQWVRRQPAVARDAAALRRPDGAGVAYLGFAGQRNIGDDAILDAHERWTVGARVRQLPVHHVPEVLRRSGPPARALPVLVGGGTLIGRDDWLRRVQDYQGAGWASTWAVLGAGVEDPEFSGRHVHASWDGLRRWAEVLPGLFGDVTVRGPLSQATLREVGLESRVVGDPALLFAEAPRPGAPVEEDVVAISVAVPEDVWGGRPQDAVDALAGAARRLVREGRRVRLVALHPADVAPSRVVARAVERPGAVEVRTPATTVELLDDLRGCGAVVGQRLHAVVLASAVSVPSLAIEYRPKCLDFQRSIGRGDWTVSTRGITADAVVERTLELLADRAGHSAHVHAGVAPLVEALHEDVRRVRARLGTTAGPELPAVTR
nr:polysaccharide pyruvyl transferase family protein [Kineococcus siccus]